MKERLETVEGRREKRLLSAVMFSPRGGSAHVTRALLHELGRRGWSVRLVSGSRTDDGGGTDAEAFYSGIDLHAVDFVPALRERDPIRPSGEVTPMHPSFEQRPGAPDSVFALLDDADFERQTEAWAGHLDAAGAAEADVLYLHHLTPINEAARRVAPGVPIVGHLHGTELLMLEQIARGAPADWSHAVEWEARMRGWASACARLVVSPASLDRACHLLGIAEEEVIPLPNGFDPDVFRPREVERYEHWKHHLVERPTAELPSGRVLAYGEEDLGPVRDGVILLYVGRFTKVKRLSLLLKAFAGARESFEQPAALILVGGHPGEWEGEHPADTISRLGLRDAFIVGWQSQEMLPHFLSAADAVILPSARESFGQTLVEGMACGLPGIAANALGPARIVEDGESGWLFGSDDLARLSAALIEAVNDPDERRRRGRKALAAVRSRFSWPLVATTLEGVLAETAGAAAESAAQYVGSGSRPSTMGSDE
jgi:glycosyltransferase involved in cell wall biosynthesis